MRTTDAAAHSDPSTRSTPVHVATDTSAPAAARRVGDALLFASVSRLEGRADSGHFRRYFHMNQPLLDVAYFSKRVSEEIARARRSGTRFSVAVFVSRPDGDPPEIACVRSLPTLLSNVRETDTVCRTGRDSIAVLLIDAAGENSQKAAVRLLDRLAGELGHWQVSVLDYPQRQSILDDLGLAVA